MIQCEKCGHQNQPIFRFCLKCGTELPRHSGAAPVVAKAKPAPERPKRVERCPHCSADLPEGRRFCAACGREAVPTEKPGPRREVGRIVLIRPDGSDGQAWPLYEGLTAVGSGAGDHVFTEDEMMSTHHADFLVEAGEAHVFDRGSRAGTFVRIQEAVPLSDGAQFRIGQQLLQVALDDLNLDPWGEVVRLASPSGEEQGRYLLEGENVFLGRERGHVTFPDDGYVSGSHAVIFRENGRAMLKDLDSSNGTYVRIPGKQKLGQRRLVLIGAHLFRVELV